MKILKEEKGFTLIELAIVLIIIGIIISIVLKGQDIVESSRMKKFETEVRHWKTSAWYFMDRKGIFPGDQDRNGIIGDEATALRVPGSTVIQGANLINPPKENPVKTGSLQFWIYWGYNGSEPKRNVMVICANNDCTVPFEDDHGAGNLKYVEFIDTVTDGTIDGTKGFARAASVPPILDPLGGDSNDRTVIAVTDPGSAWATGVTKALVFYVDKGVI
ncbi:MAG: prepilin-type N-terminal cleavage/methylation domain-containing protein [Thermodesulfovibrionia bacterium]|nr:prepilin-type N-terminal cleavage/methylation domain-containing protein [Thermodesulfovibrionia bacterium]